MYYFNDIKEKNYGSIEYYVEVLKENYTEYKLNTKDFISFLNEMKLDERKNVRALAAKIENFVVKMEQEKLRVKSMYDYDRSHLNEGLIAGVDEVGRGPLAGPIVAASVILKQDYSSCKDLILGIKDSKKLSAKQREELSKIIKDKALSYSISELSNHDIDTKGIAWCNNEAFKIAISGLNVEPQLVLSDGYRIKEFDLPNIHVIKGDEKSASIACASIIAKVYRDNLMKEYSRDYPYYGFEGNAGYGSKEHIEAIKRNGICKLHRTSFLTNII